MPNSPSVPSSPSSPASPPPPCLSCWVWIAEQLSNPDFRPYDDADICTAARNSIVEAMNNLNENQGGNAILSGFDAEGTQCDGNRVYSCGAFVSVEAGSAFVNELTTLFSPSEQISVGVPESLRNQACAPPGANFRLRGYTNEGGVPGVEVNDNSPADVCAPEADDACRVNSPPAPLTPSPPDTGFPFCACNKRPNATPFKLSELTEVVVGEDTGRSRTCFTVVANPDVDASLPCGRTTELLKMEFLLNYDNRRTMTDIYTSKDGETPQKRAQSWDNANGVLKVSPLGWTVDDLELNPRICFEFKDGFSLEDVLRTPGQMQYSAFDPTKGCCATNWYYSE